MLTRILFTALLAAQAAAQPRPPTSPCARELEESCRHTAHDERRCYDCVHENERKLQAAKCQRHELEEFCGGAEDRCTTDLRRACPERHTNHDDCARCVQQHERDLARVCSREQLGKYCAGGSDHPQCEPTLARECGDSKGKGRACDHCLRDHYEVLAKAGCDHATLDRFCQPAI